MLVLAAVFTTSLIIYIFQSIKRSPVVDRELHHNAFDLSLHTFIEAARRSSYHAYDSEEIKRVCLASKWRTNVATHCGLLSGDIGESTVGNARTQR